MSENAPVTLQIVFTPQEPSAPTPQVLRDWVAREVEKLSPVFVNHTVEDGQPTSTAFGHADRDPGSARRGDRLDLPVRRRAQRRGRQHELG